MEKLTKAAREGRLGSTASIRLATGLSRAFDLIASSVEQLQPGPLTLSCSSTIMMSWLIPRIGAFHELHPDIELRFNMNYDRIDFVRDEISVAIRNSMIEPPKEVIIKDMINEWIGPVCSPEYASKHFQTVHDLDRCALLATKTRPDGWADWARIRLNPASCGHKDFTIISIC